MSSSYLRSMRVARLVVVAALLAGCGMQRTVQEGWLQKRRLQHGWHVDLHRQATAPSAVRTATCEWQQCRAHVLRTPLAGMDDRLLASTRSVNLVVTSPKYVRKVPTGEQVAVKGYGALDPISPSREWPSDRTTEPVKERNMLAIPTLVLAVGTISLAVLTTSTTAVLLGCLAAVVIGAISLKQIRTREQSGKGFALVGFILGLIALLITAMAIATLGFV